MATSINTNLASLFAQNSLSNAQNNLASSVQRLSSGLRINSAKDDAAGLSIAQNMQSQINGTNQSIRNLSDATNLLQVADSSLSTVQDMLLRLKQLSVQGFDGSLSASQKLNIVQEMKDLNNEINATAQRTQFNGIKLLTSGSSLDTVNSDVKNGVTLINSAAQVSTTSGLGAGSTLNDAGNTIYSLSLTDSKAQYAPGSYTLQASENNLTMTGTFQGKVQSQTVALADLVGYAPSTSGLNRPVITNINFSNFGIEMRLTSSIAAGTTETGATLAAAIIAKSNSIVVDGKGGQISNVKLSGVNPGTYQMTFGNTGSVASFGMPAGLVSGQTSAGTARSVALVGGNGSGATANISYDAQGKISSIAVATAGTGYKAGDVLSTAAITAGTVNAATISTLQGSGAATERANVTFSGLNANEVMTLAGLTFKAGASGATAAQVANAFSNLANGAITGTGTNVANGSGAYSGTFNGWSTGAANGAAVQFSSTVPNADIDDLAATAASDRPVVAVTQGASDITESASVKFKALTAGESFQLGGLTFTAGSATLTAGEVARAFMGLEDGFTFDGAGASTNANDANADRTAAGGGALALTTGTFTAGTFTGWGSVGATRSTGTAANDTLVFTSSSANSDVTDLAPVGVPTITTTAGGAGGVREQAAVTFDDDGLAAGETMRLGGLMFTAGSGDLSKIQVAEAFANLANGATTGAGATYGTYSGALNGWTTGAANGVDGDIVNFASTSSTSNVENLTAGTRGTNPTIVTTVPGDGTNTEVATADFAATGTLANGTTMTLGGLTFTAGLSGATAQQLAAAFANLQNGVTGSQLNTTGQSVYGTFSGTFSGWNTDIVEANGTLVTFTSSIANTDVPTLAAAEVGTAPAISIVEGQTSGTESASAEFTALSAGQSLTMGGLTFTSTSGSTAAQVARAFANLASGVSPTELALADEVSTFTFSAMTAGSSITVNGLTLTNGTGATISAANVAQAFGTEGVTLNGLTASGAFGATFNGAWTAGATATFTSATANSNVIDIVYSSAGAAPTSPAAVKIDGASAARNETSTVTFTDMTAGQTITVAGLTYTSTGATTAANVASYFADDGTYGVAGATPDGALTGAYVGFTAAVAAVGSAVVFTSATPNDNVIDITIAGTGTATAVTLDGASAARNETSTVTFSGMTAGQSVTVAGLTYTSTGVTTAAEAASYFSTNGGTYGAAGATPKGVLTGAITGWTTTAASVGAALVFTSTTANNDVAAIAISAAGAPANLATATTVDGISSAGTYTGTFTGWTTGSADGDTVVFTSQTGAADVENLTGYSSQNPTVTTVNQGSTAATETALVTFNALTANQTVTMAGLTFTAGSTGASADEVASYFSTSGAYGVAGATPKGVMTGTRSGWTSTAAASGATLVFTSSTADANVDDLAAPVSGAAPLIITTQQGGSVNSTETAQVTFDAADMTSGDSVTVGGLTFTAGANGATRAQVAAAFSNLPAGTSSANLSSANGTFSGTLTGWSTGAPSSTGVSFTSATASTNVDNLTSSVSRRQALNALSGIVVGGLDNQSGENLLTMSGLVNGSLQTQALSLKDNAANTSQTLNFDMFGVQFDVDSFQAQTGGEIGAVLASLNSSSANYGTTGAFVPGQVVVSQGANSALKFQSGADSSSFIQIDTLNIQTGSSGIEAGSDKQMMDVGSVITDSGVGKLGALGLNDSIDTWQTAFKNAAAAVDEAIEYVSSKRATYGSQMNRLSFVTTNLTAQSTNLQNSRSAIIDTDFASETAKLTKGQIMQQAATAMLAQANQMPNVILSLLK